MGGESLATPYGQFPHDWVARTLANLCDSETSVQTGPFGSQLHQEDYVETGTPILTVEHLGENRVIHDSVPCVSDDDRTRLSRYSLRAGDIVFSRVGSVDRRALVRSTEEGWLFSGRCLRVRVDPKKIDPVFLSYFFGLPAFREHIRAIAVGATMPSLNTALLSNVLVPHPGDLSEQRAIAHILGTLDDKIELNRRMNETLEALARALFKSWFVDFDPVRAKMEGRWRRGESLPGLPAHLYELFPDRLVDSELGEIPEGWEVTAVRSYASLNPETWSKRSQPTMIRYVDLSNTKWGRIEAMTTYLMSEAPSRARRVLRPGDTIVGTVRPGNGSYALVCEDGLTGSTGFAVLRPLQEDYVTLVYLAATARESIYHLAQLADGGAYPAVKPEAVLSVPIMGPPDQVLGQFSQATLPLLRQFWALENESRALAALRDTLLPKLVSGEIRVSERMKTDLCTAGALEESE